MAVYEMQHDN